MPTSTLTVVPTNLTWPGALALAALLLVVIATSTLAVLIVARAFAALDSKRRRDVIELLRAWRGSSHE